MLFIQNNLPCIDKFDKLPNNNNGRTQNARDASRKRHINTRDIDKYHKMFTNALVLYPGQYYYDLGLSFTQEYRTMGISYFSDDNSQELINKQYYNDTLSNLIEQINSGNLPPEKYDSTVLVNPNKTKYFIIDCCRNYDSGGYSMSSTARRNYIYENLFL